MHTVEKDFFFPQAIISGSDLSYSAQASFQGLLCSPFFGAKIYILGSGNVLSKGKCI